MASVTNKEIPDEFNLFGEIFTMYKKFYHPEDNKDYWSALIENSHEISNKYNTELARDLCLVVIDELERKRRDT